MTFPKNYDLHKGPFSGQTGEVKAEKVPLEAVVEGHELAVPT